MNENDQALLNDMLDYARRTQRRVDGNTPDDLVRNDYLLGDAILRSIEIVGEATSRVSGEFQAQHSEIAWSKIIGMRNRLIHGYTRINWGMVWDIAVQDIPILVQQLEHILSKES